jgi:hypothetical protein
MSDLVRCKCGKLYQTLPGYVNVAGHPAYDTSICPQCTESLKREYEEQEKKTGRNSWWDVYGNNAKLINQGFK